GRRTLRAVKDRFRAWEEAAQLRWETPKDCRPTIGWPRDLGRRRLLHLHLHVRRYAQAEDLSTDAGPQALAVEGSSRRAFFLHRGGHAVARSFSPAGPSYEVACELRKVPAGGEKYRLAARNCNLYLPIVFRKAWRSLRV